MRTRLVSAAGPVFVAAGLLHFAKPKVYESIMPDWVPAHRAMVYASGVAEAAGGAGLMWRGARRQEVRRWSAWWLVATLAGVFPANVHMALHPERYPGIPRPALLARLPIQALFVRWVLAAGRRG